MADTKIDNGAFARRARARREGLRECAKCPTLVKDLSIEGYCGTCQQRVDNDRRAARLVELLKKPLDQISDFEDLRLIAQKEGVTIDARHGLDRARGDIEARRRRVRDQQLENERKAAEKARANEQPIAGDEREAMLRNARSGKTTAMLSDALSRAMQGESVVVVGVNTDHARQLHRTLVDELRKAGVKFDTPVHDVIRLEPSDSKIKAATIQTMGPDQVERTRGYGGTMLVDPDAALTGTQRDIAAHHRFLRHPYA